MSILCIPLGGGRGRSDMWIHFHIIVAMYVERKVHGLIDSLHWKFKKQDDLFVVYYTIICICSYFLSDNWNLYLYCWLLWLWVLIIALPHNTNSGILKWAIIVQTHPSSWWAPSWIWEMTRRPLRNSRRSDWVPSPTPRYTLQVFYSCLYTGLSPTWGSSFVFEKWLSWVSCIVLCL